ncbi:MAG: glycine/sarcosine/betaine reductase complex component C subunit alpha [Synergistota bacterium]|nr:glycine/sarcosine/betaine reductase complex component C subunit alpha [Synergistota bacterium]
MTDLGKTIGEELSKILTAAEKGGPVVRLGLMASGSELGPEELVAGARLADGDPGLEVVMIGPRIDGFDDLEWIETGDCEADIAEALDRALTVGTVAGAVALHYPFPLGVTTIGRVLTPGRGRPMLLASSTGASAAERLEAMVRNAIYGKAVAMASGNHDPSVGILNVEGAQLAFRALKRLKDNGYDIRFGESTRKDGGAVLRGNDMLAGAVDVCVQDTLTGNVMMKLFSSWTTGGSYESLGWGYGPSTGENWRKIISIISRASGAPVIAGALRFTAEMVAGDLPGRVAGELAKAREAGLEEVLADISPKPHQEENVSPPPQEPTGEELHGVDVLSIEAAVRALWKEGIYAESAMGCTGPVVKAPARVLEDAKRILEEKGYL